jgi:ATP-binding cassette subfamily B protein
MRRLTVQEFERHSRAQEVLALLNERCAQAAGSLRLARLTGTERVWERRSGEVAADYRGRRLAVAQTSFRFGLVDGVVRSAALIVLLFLGVWRYHGGAITLGELVALQIYLTVLQGPLGDIGVIISEWQRGIASLKRLVAILYSPEDARFARTGTFAPREQKDAPVLQLQGVRLQGRAREPLEQPPIDLEVGPGERIGIQGRVGSGKSVLLETIAGLRERLAGDIAVLGSDLDTLEPGTLHRAVTLVPQAPFVFADTVRSNVLLDRSAPDDEVWHWLDVAGFSAEVRSLPGGLDAALGEWGINLSGGQRQRLTLARALAARPALLLLDDCLSAVDPIAEAKIFEALGRELARTAVLWAGHRPSALAHCTRIVRLGRS